MSCAQVLELAGEAHDVDQRRAQIVADDVGEALDLVVGFAQVGGALLHRGFQVEIVVAQLGLGFVARVGRAPHQDDRNAGQHQHQPRAGRGDRSPPATGCGRRPCVRSRNSRCSSARISWASSRIRSMVAVPALMRMISVAASSFLSRLSSSTRRNWASRASLSAMISISALLLRGIVAGLLLQLPQQRQHALRGLLELLLEFRLFGQQIAALGAFGAADLQQRQRDLVLDFQGVRHPAGVLAGALQPVQRGDADRHQHQEGHRQQHDLQPLNGGGVRAGLIAHARNNQTCRSINSPAARTSRPATTREPGVGSAGIRPNIAAQPALVSPLARYCSSQWMW